MNMPKRASRHQAIRASCVFIDSRHQASSGLSLSGTPSELRCESAANVSDGKSANQKANAQVKTKDHGASLHNTSDRPKRVGVDIFILSEPGSMQFSVFRVFRVFVVCLIVAGPDCTFTNANRTPRLRIHRSNSESTCLCTSSLPVLNVCSRPEFFGSRRSGCST